MNLSEYISSRVIEKIGNSLREVYSSLGRIDHGSIVNGAAFNCMWSVIIDCEEIVLAEIDVIFEIFHNTDKDYLCATITGPDLNMINIVGGAPGTLTPILNKLVTNDANYDKVADQICSITESSLTTPFKITKLLREKSMRPTSYFGRAHICDMNIAASKK